VTVLAGFLGEVGTWVQVILGVGLLVFIHEMGHFLVAKWAGVRVLAFSLGFGPEIWGFTRGPTRYRVSWVPLGGYVKMSGENELPEGGFAPDDYPAQPVWKRSLIIIAGVAMNAVLGFTLFAAALGVGMRLEPVVLGTVAMDGAAWEQGIRPGDRVVAVDGERTLFFADLVFATLEGDPVVLDIERDGKPLRVEVAPRVDNPRSKTPGIGVSAGGGSRFAVPAGGTAEKAGFRDGDVVVALDGIPGDLDLLGDDLFVSAVQSPHGPLNVAVRRGTETVEVPVGRVAPKTPRRMVGIVPLRTTIDRVRPGSAAEAAGWLAGDRPLAVAGAPVRGAGSFGRAVMEAHTMGPVEVRVARAGGGAEALILFPPSREARFAMLHEIRFARPSPAAAVEVLRLGPPGPDGKPAPSPAEAAGIPNGAVVTAAGGAKEIADFADIAMAVAAVESGPVEFAWTLGKETGSAKVHPVEIPVLDAAALAVATGGEEVLVRAAGPGEALSLAATRCVLTSRQIKTTIAGLFRGSVDKGNLGGPILIAQVAHQSSKRGFGQFLWLLGMLSINLMFLNVLPIPLLDGGQLALLALEGATRRRPSEALVGITQMVGLVVILGLTVIISFNDVLRLIR
jgi:regulator of sigma E protease